MITSDDLDALSTFVYELANLSRKTGVSLDHYDRVQLKLPSGADVFMAGTLGERGYDVEIREQ